VYDYALPILNDNDDHEPYYFDPRMQTHHSGHAAKLAIAEVYPQDTPADDL
jgi:hypothetical protein